MASFNFEKKKEGDYLVMIFSGQIDEDANFSSIDFSGSKKIYFELKDVTSINSCGIREWIKWVRTAPTDAKISFRHCPKVIVDQINMVAGFLPENATVESFYVPYYSEESGSEKMVLYTKGKEFSESGELNFPASVKCDESGKDMEIDVIEAKYFKFLKKG